MTDSVSVLRCCSIAPVVLAGGHSSDESTAQKFPYVAVRYSP